jgi:hypothetical protein
MIDSDSPNPTPDPNSSDDSPPTRSPYRLAGPSHVGASIFGFWPKKIISIKALRLTFKTDHHVMTDNNTDWENTGSVFAKPEWTYGNPSKPISHTKNQKVVVSVDFEVNPSNADPIDGVVTGTATFGSVVFAAASQSFNGGSVTVQAESTGPLPDLVQELTGDVRWSVKTKDQTYDAGASWGHTIYVTMDTPVSVSGREAGITQKRMDKSVSLVQGTGKATAPWADAPQGIVNSLMSTISGYTLLPDPAVNNARPGVNHPAFFNSIGGAWNIADFISNSAECQAIVRFFRAVIKQVGCPGTAQIMLVYADPTVNNGNTVLEDDFETTANGGLHHVPNQTFNGQNCFAALLDADPGTSPGKMFDSNRTGRLPGIGCNAFEACMKFTDPGGTTKYYPGGTSGGVMNSKEQVINVFQALAWMSNPPGGHPGEDLVKVEKIVKHY